jgi:hypothetical protein
MAVTLFCGFCIFQENFSIMRTLITMLTISCFIVTATGQTTSESTIPGLSFLKNIQGLWAGPVYSSTPAGSFDVWNVDFRAVSSNRISQYTTNDETASNYTEFFIATLDQSPVIVMRTMGTFMNKGCITYEKLDSVDEMNGYYQFSDMVAGRKRASTIFQFYGDSLIMTVYTNKFNKEPSLVLHSMWKAKRSHNTEAEKAAKHFGFPSLTGRDDFAGIFKNMDESIIFDLTKDPYTPSLPVGTGKLTVQIKLSKELPDADKGEICLLLTTDPLIVGLRYLPENLKYVSRAIYLKPGTTTYTFENIHAGHYYLYSYSDMNNDKKHKKGDYMSSSTSNTLDVFPAGTTNYETAIDMIIP